CCLTSLVVRVDMSDDPAFATLVTRVRDDLITGLANLVPFETVVRALRVRRASGSNPIFQCAIVLEPQTAGVDPAWTIDEMDVEIGNVIGHSKFDLLIELEERADGSLRGRLIYDTDLLGPITARRIAAHWQRLLSAGVGTPG